MAGGRRPAPAELAAERWDLVVIGGGITGAGILLEAVRIGLRTLLIEQRDFAWGTSSRSSKMVHGGLRYLAQGDIRLTRHALQERELLQRELPELVAPQHWLFPVRAGEFPGRIPLTAALWAYDRLAGIDDHLWLTRDDVRHLVPGINTEGLVGAMRYTDALTDDSRLVMRVLHEARALGGVACNYLEATAVHQHREDEGFVITVRDRVDDDTLTLEAGAVINATGAWADTLSRAAPRVRPQRGSHLFVPRERFPVTHCLTLKHQDDGRPVFVFPWEGVTCIGTTDLDHRESLDREPRCTVAEVDYLLRLVNIQFPELELTCGDVISSMAGVRPIIASGRSVAPSKERRDHAVWQADGVITVSGGKLTTFRLIALDALHLAGLITPRERARRARNPGALFGRAVPPPAPLENPHGNLARSDELEDVLRWCLEHEQVVHLDDLMLRRTRLGLLLPEGAADLLPMVGALCGELLGWDGARWQQELTRYREIWRDAYSPPAQRGGRQQLAPVEEGEQARPPASGA